MPRLSVPRLGALKLRPTRAIIPLVSGEVSVRIGSIPAVMPYFKAGRARALGVTTAKRDPAIPEVPTIAEAGVPGFAAGQWWGMFAPAGTSKDIIARLNGEIHRILATEEMKQRLANEGAEPAPMPRRPVFWRG